jgi:hypothetical protein
MALMKKTYPIIIGGLVGRVVVETNRTFAEPVCITKKMNTTA